MFKLYYKGKLLSEHRSFEDAEAQARWDFFEWRSMAWEGLEMPPGFMIVPPPVSVGHTL